MRRRIIIVFIHVWAIEHWTIEIKGFSTQLSCMNLCFFNLKMVLLYQLSVSFVMFVGLWTCTVSCSCHCLHDFDAESWALIQAYIWFLMPASSHLRQEPGDFWKKKWRKWRGFFFFVNFQLHSIRFKDYKKSQMNDFLFF